jgi:hypothetical protein
MHTARGFSLAAARHNKCRHIVLILTAVGCHGPICWAVLPIGPSPATRFASWRPHVRRAALSRPSSSSVTSAPTSYSYRQQSGLVQSQANTNESPLRHARTQRSVYWGAWSTPTSVTTAQDPTKAEPHTRAHLPGSREQERNGTQAKRRGEGREPEVKANLPPHWDQPK